MFESNQNDLKHAHARGHKTLSLSLSLSLDLKYDETVPVHSSSKVFLSLLLS